MSHHYEEIDFRPLRENELEFNRLHPAQDYCSTAKCGKPTTHVRIVGYQHFKFAARFGGNGRREKRLRLCAECAAKFAAKAVQA